MKRYAYSLVFSSLTLAVVSNAIADQHPTVQALSSRPGAGYTLYVDFAGFNFTGTWGNTGASPGSTNAYFDVASNGSFNASQNAAIKEVWERIAEKYVAFNINVTTIDPAVGAGLAGTDAQRQKYYDDTAQIMHTVVGGGGSWYGPAGGVSYVGVAQNTQNTSGNGGFGMGYHTNWVFAAEAPTAYQFVGEATAHEDGHGLSLSHQSDYNGGGYQNEYSAGNGTGNGSYAPTMGVSYYSQRGTWRVGASSGLGGGTQNDVSTLLSNNNMGGLLDDGIGHSFATATTLSLTGTTVNPGVSKGFIKPSSNANPTAIGEGNYTSDVFAFASTGGVVSLTATDGSQYITPGVADPGATLNSNLRIYDANGNLVGVATKDSTTLFETYSGNLVAGNYFAVVTSNGGLVYGGQYNNASYYDMGSYFLTGSGALAAPVPEPASMVALVAGIGMLARRRRARK